MGGYRVNLLTTTETAERLGVTRQAFHNSILPLLIQEGHAQKIGRYWVIDGKMFWQWEDYATTRQNLIEAGIWIARRPWSRDDYLAITSGQYEDYGPPADWPEDDD
jgi:hypothetical protein